MEPMEDHIDVFMASIGRFGEDVDCGSVDENGVANFFIPNPVAVLLNGSSLPPPGSPLAALLRISLWVEGGTVVIQGATDLIYALRKVRDENSTAVFDVAMTALSKILGNIHSNPFESKFRKIKTTNAYFQRSLGSISGGHDLMKKVWFDRETIDGEECYTFRYHPNDPQWGVFKTQWVTVQQAQRDSSTLNRRSPAPPAVHDVGPPLNAYPGIATVEGKRRHLVQTCQRVNASFERRCNEDRGTVVESMTKATLLHSLPKRSALTIYLSSTRKC